MTRTAPNGYDHHRGTLALLRTTRPAVGVAFMCVNLLGYLLVNAFWQYLATGQWLDLSPLSFRTQLSIPVGDMLLRPLSVFTHPWMILVAGCLLAAIVLVPVIVSVLYSLTMAIALAAVVAVLGHSPMLALVVVAGCVLATRTPMRSDTPFVAVLVGIVPAGAYFYFFAFFGPDAAGGQPFQRLALAAPFVLALVAAILAAAGVLWLARLTKFRPGVVWPALAVLAGVPIATFYLRVGGDELQYAIITEHLAPGDAVLEPLAMDTWTRQNRTEGLNPQTLKDRINDDLQRRQQELLGSCLGFVARYPRSPRAPELLWAAGQAMSLQLDSPALAVGLIKYSASFPLPTSSAIWQRLASEYPNSPQAAVAHWRLGELALRRGEVSAAYSELLKALRSLAEAAPASGSSQSPGKAVEVFMAASSVPSTRYYGEAAFAVQRLLWLMDSNGVSNDPSSAAALAAYLDCNPHEAGYYEALAALAGNYEGTNMGDNLKLAVALACQNLYERAEMLILLAGRQSSDAAIEANYELARLTMRTPEAPALPLVENLRQAEDYFRAVKDAGPSPWWPIAAEYLAWRKPPTRPVATASSPSGD